MEIAIIAGIYAALALCLWLLFRKKKSRLSAEQVRKIKRFAFPEKVSGAVQNKYPHLSDAEVDKVLDGLRSYFILCAMSPRRMVAMPSQAVDVAWHEFILFTRAYQQFCNEKLGFFLHHTPAEAMATPTEASKGIKRAWRLACAQENIDYKNPRKLPLLFAIDARLKIPDGFHFKRNCERPGKAATAATSTGHVYCATHIGCAAGCAGSSAGFGVGGSSGEGHGCGGNGGCGGD